MAYITKHGKLFRVRWRDRHSRTRQESFDNRDDAKLCKAEVETSIAKGRGWQLDGSRRVPVVRDVFAAFIKDQTRVRRPATVRRHAGNLDLFLRWLDESTGRQGGHRFDLFSKQLLADYYDALLETGRHGHARRRSTVKKIVEAVQRAWAWAYNEDDYTSLIPPPKRLEMPEDPGAPTVAPTWEEMDACVDACSGWHRQVAVMLRFTGLRVQQVMLLRWDDVDLERGLLTIRGELGKTRQERRGRIVPLSLHLLEELRGWGPGEGWMIPCGRDADGPRPREARARDMGRAWKRAGVREEVWRRRPHHAFRKGVKTGLKRLGADSEAVEFLLGHDLGIAGIYTDPEGLPLRDAVNKIPPLGYLAEVVDLRPREGAAVL